MERHDADVIEIMEAVDWNSQPPDLFVKAINVALSTDAVRLARRLADLGHQRYPEHDLLGRMARVLAPPRPSVLPSMQWISQHGGPYRG
jgi:hypothetical protein